MNSYKKENDTRQLQERSGGVAEAKFLQKSNNKTFLIIFAKVKPHTKNGTLPLNLKMS